MKIARRLQWVVAALGIWGGNLTVMPPEAFGQSVVTNSRPALQKNPGWEARPFENLSDASLRAVAAMKAGKPQCVLSFASHYSQMEIFSVIEPVTVRQGLDQYIDGFCGYGARLSRDYVGESSLVNVAFH